MTRSSHQGPTIASILDSHDDPDQSILAQLQEEWEEMDPATFVSNGRRLAYQRVIPALEKSNESQEVKDAVLALFESTFKLVESGSSAKVGGRRSSSRSSGNS